MRGELGRASQAVSYFASPLFHFSSTFFFPFPFSNPQSASIQPGKLSISGNFVSYISLLSVLYPSAMFVKLENYSGCAGLFLPY